MGIVSEHDIGIVKRNEELQVMYFNNKIKLELSGKFEDVTGEVRIQGVGMREHMTRMSAELDARTAAVRVQLEDGLSVMRTMLEEQTRG